MTQAIVTGASRGFGLATTVALIKTGVDVVGVARDRSRLEQVRASLGEAFTPVAGDAADPGWPGSSSTRIARVCSS